MWLIFRIIPNLINNRWNLKETKKKIGVCTYKIMSYLYYKTYKVETRSIQFFFKIADWECSLHANTKCYIVLLYHHKSSALVLYQMFVLSLCHIYYMDILWTSYSLNAPRKTLRIPQPHLYILLVSYT